MSQQDQNFIQQVREQKAHFPRSSYMPRNWIIILPKKTLKIKKNK